jgi:hypothetical protein
LVRAILPLSLQVLQPSGFSLSNLVQTDTGLFRNDLFRFHQFNGRFWRNGRRVPKERRLVHRRFADRGC